VLKILQQPYPFGEKSNIRLLIQSIGEGTFIALFLILFQPLGVSDWNESNKLWYLACYGLITVFCVLVLRFGIFKVFHKYHSETTWNVGKEILSILLLILMITVVNVFFSNIAFNLNISLKSFFWMLIGVMIIGIFPATFGVMLNPDGRFASEPRLISPTAEPAGDPAMMVFLAKARAAMRTCNNLGFDVPAGGAQGEIRLDFSAR
jgi:hypothetical protein